MPYSHDKEKQQDRGIANSVKRNRPIMSGQMGTFTDLTGPAVIRFDDFFVDQGGISYNTGNGRFTVPEAGVYRITMNPFKKSGAFVDRVMIGINNPAPTQSNHKGMCYTNSANFITMCLNSVVTLAANDYIVFYLFAGVIYNQPTDRFNQFTIERIA
jgi:hypothetical protein